MSDTMNTTEADSTPPNSPAVGAPVPRGVRPRAWALPILGRFGGGDYLRSTPAVDADAAAGLAGEPLFDRAAMEAAVSAMRDRCARLCELKIAEAHTRALADDGWTTAEITAFVTAAESIAAAIRDA